MLACNLLLSHYYSQAMQHCSFTVCSLNYKRGNICVLALQGPRRTQSFLLPGAGSQMPCIQSHRAPLQNQAHLTTHLLLFRMNHILVLVGAIFNICILLGGCAFFLF